MFLDGVCTTYGAVCSFAVNSEPEDVVSDNEAIQPPPLPSFFILQYVY